MTQTGRIQASDGKYLPIVSAYARTVGLVEEVDRLCGAQEGVGYGTVVLPPGMGHSFGSFSAVPSASGVCKAGYRLAAGRAAHA